MRRALALEAKSAHGALEAAPTPAKLVRTRNSRLVRPAARARWGQRARCTHVVACTSTNWPGEKCRAEIVVPTCGTHATRSFHGSATQWRVVPRQPAPSSMCTASASSRNVAPALSRLKTTGAADVGDPSGAIADGIGAVDASAGGDGGGEGTGGGDGGDAGSVASAGCGDVRQCPGICAATKLAIAPLSSAPEKSGGSGMAFDRNSKFPTRRSRMPCPSSAPSSAGQRLPSARSTRGGASAR